MMGKHIATRPKINWQFELRYYRHRLHFYIKRLLKAYISRGTN